MITITASAFNVTTQPAVAPVAAGQQADGLGHNVAGASFSVASGIEAVGSVTFQGLPGDTGNGWNVGFLQAQWVETNWAVYRGRTPAAGSVFVQRGRRPARPNQACFDCLNVNAPFYGTGAFPPTAVPATGGPPLPFVAPLPAHPAFPLTLSVIHRDFPGDFYPFQRPNQTTHQPNLLSEAQLEFAFCISLVVREPGGRIHFLWDVYWNVEWQARFTFAAGAAVPAITPVAGDTGANVSRLIAGRPSDRRFIQVLTIPQATNCNAIAAAAAQSPHNFRETVGWPLFDVTR